MFYTPAIEIHINDINRTWNLGAQIGLYVNIVSLNFFYFPAAPTDL